MPSFLVILMFCAFISIHFCGFISVHSRVLSLHVLSFWLFVAPFAFMSAFLWLYFYPLIFAFCGFISFQFCLLTFHFGLLGFHFLSVLPSHLSFPFICPFSPFISFHFGLLALHFLLFWPFELSFPFGFAFSPFIPFHLSLLTLHFLSFWPSRPSFPFILTPWVFM